MANGKAEPIANGTPGIKLNNLKSPSANNLQVLGMQETQFSEPHRKESDPTSLEHSVLLQTLLDIKQDIKRDINSLSGRMNKLDLQIEEVVHTIMAAPTRRDSGSTLRIESDTLNESAKSSSSDTRSISPDSNSSNKVFKKPSKKVKGSKVSPKPLPALNNTGSSPVKSKMGQRRESSLSLAGESGASGLTLTTTIDPMDEESSSIDNNQRKDKISNLDML